MAHIFFAFIINVIRTLHMEGLAVFIRIVQFADNDSENEAGGT